MIFIKGLWYQDQKYFHLYSIQVEICLVYLSSLEDHLLSVIGSCRLSIQGIFYPRYLNIIFSMGSMVYPPFGVYSWKTQTQENIHSGKLRLCCGTYSTRYMV